MADDPRAAYEHYAKLVESLLPPGGPAFEPVAEDDSAIQVERGLVLPTAVTGAAPDRIASAMDRLLRPGSSKLRVIDAAGHVRPPYPGLLVYAWWRARAVVTRDLPRADVPPHCPAFTAWAARLVAAIARARQLSYAGVLAGTDTADALADCAWSALGSIHAGDSWVFPRILGICMPSGAFLPTSASSNPEPFWYHELVLLHAVTAYAINWGNAAAREAAVRNAEYHLHETQPDHATNEPWGLLAFILNPNTRSLADQLLHTARVHHPAGAQGVTAILLADVLDHLRELARRPG